MSVTADMLAGGVADTAESFGQWLSGVGTVCLWTAVLLRTRTSARSPYQRGLWLAVATAAMAMTLHHPVVTRLLADTDVPVHDITVAKNMFGVISAGAVLYFVTMTTGGRDRRIWLGGAVGGTLTAIAVLLLLDDNAPAHQEHTITGTGSATPSVAYWLVLMSTHIVANTVCVAVCWRYAAGAGTPDNPVNPLLRSGLWLFGLGTALAGLYWLGQLTRLLADPSWLPPYLPVLMGAHALFRAAALLLPTLLALGGLATDIAAVWRLRPLWRDLVAAAPHVVLTRPRPRLLELLWPPVPWELLVYRRVIETRDAMLVLHDYAEPHVLAAARAHVAAAGVPDSRAEAAVLACVLRQARTAKEAGQPREVRPTSPTGLEDGGLAGERTFLLDVAKAYRSPVTTQFTTAPASNPNPNPTPNSTPNP